MEVQTTSNLLLNSPANDRVPQKSLESQDFLKLLVTQLSNQDPLKPTDGNQMLAQMAQITSVQTMTQLQKSMDRMRTDQQVTLGQGLIGKNVQIYDSASGDEAIGPVSKVSFDSSGTVQLTVNGTLYPIANLQAVLPDTPEGTTAPTP